LTTPPALNPTKVIKLDDPVLKAAIVVAPFPNSIAD
jgi:hypothetical protein